MHFALPPTVLPSWDYDRLQRLMLTMIGSRTALASILRRKLCSADRVHSFAVPREVALSGTRVRFRIDDQDVQERTLTWEPPNRGDSENLSLRSARGLALLGLSPGESVSYRTENDRTEFLKVERVFRGTDSAPPSAEELLPAVPGGSACSVHLTSSRVTGGQNA